MSVQLNNKKFKE